MAMKDNFLREVKIGDRVELMISTKEMEGVIIALDLDTVRIRRDNGKEPVLSLDSITYYEVSDDESENSELSQTITEAVKEEAIAAEEIRLEKPVQEISVSKVEEKTDAKTIDVVSTEKAKDLIDDAIQELNKRGNSLFEMIEMPVVRSVRDVAKMTENLSLRNEINGISDSIDYAINQVHEASPADYKIQENIGKIKRLIRNYPRSKTPSSLLGAVYFRCKCETLALEAYENGDDNESAFAIAEILHNEDKKISFAVRHFVLDRGANAYIYRFLLEKMLEKDDYSVCSKISIKGLVSDKLHAYHSFVRILLLINGIEYNAMLDFDITEASVDDLLRIFKGKSIGSKVEMIHYLPSERVTVRTQVVQQDTRTLDECPIFAAAEHARMEEKDLLKAEKLYIKAIKANEKPGSAVANLYQILIQKRRFMDCAMYLGRYGSKYMREEAYNNLKRQLLSAAPSMRQEIVKYEKEDKDPTDYFLLAQKAELEEKDLQKAINYYKKAIEQKQRLSGSVPNLAAIYSRLEMFDEALTLLNTTGKTAMDRAAYLNLKMTILGKARDKKYKDELLSTYNQIRENTPSTEKKADLLFSEAYILAQMEEYELAIDMFKKCLIKCTPKTYATREKFNKQHINILTGLCNAYYKFGNMADATKYANEILTLDSVNEFAKSILSGRVDEDAELITENIGITHINKFIQDRIDELSLDSEVKNKSSLENGVFVAPQEQAIRIMDAIRDSKRGSVNDEAKSNEYLAGAKLTRQILDRDEDIIAPEIINEQKYLYFIAEGSCAYANSRLYRTELADNMDVARYFYIQTVTIFNDSGKVRSCWVMATLRYIETFFYTVDEIRHEGNTLTNKNKEFRDCISTIQKMMSGNIRVDINVFTIGMIEFLSYNTKVKKQVLSFINANAFQGKILDVLAKILDTVVSDISSDAEFESVWDDAAKMYSARRKAYLKLICETVDRVFEVGKLRDNIEKLKSSQFDQFFNNTDKEYIRELYDIFNTILRYSEISEFDYKAETLKRAEDARKRLEEKIQEYPTFFSYEKLLSEIIQMQAKIFKESALLYGNSEPQIEVSISGDSSVEEEAKLVRVPIAFTNRANAQNADNVQISIIGEGVENVNDTQLSRGLLVGDGCAREEMITFRITDKVFKEQVFSIEITLNYQYQKNMTEVEEMTKKHVLSVPLYSDSKFEMIENKFEPHKNGSEVKDANMFYGRDKDIENIISQISDEGGRILQGRCLALYGQTRTGKSSLLYHLEKKLREINPDGNIIVNIGSIGEENLTGNDITEFLYTILDGLKNEITFRHTELKSILDDAGIVLDADRLLDDPERSQLFFNNEFKKVCRLLANQQQHYNIILMIDEFTYIYDWIRRGSMTDRIMKFWKAFIQNNGIFAIIIGQDHMMRFVGEKQFTNDFGSTDLRKITYLSEEDAKRLMYEPIMYINENGESINRYREGALDRLYELTSGSAFLIMNICAGLVDYLNEVHSVYITRAHIDDYLRKNLASFEEARFFEPQYDDKSEVDSTEAVERNKKMLRRIAQQSNKKEWTPLQSVILSEEDRVTVENLQLRDVVIVENNDRCKIKVALYKEWIFEKYGLEASHE